MEWIVAFAVLRWNIVIGMSLVFNNYSIYNRAASCFKRRSSLKVLILDGPHVEDHRQRP